jgi:hypothetical protein
MLDWQLILVALFVLAAAGYLAWTGWRVWHGSKNRCGGGCACSTKASKTAEQLIPIQQLNLRIRD